MGVNLNFASLLQYQSARLTTAASLATRLEVALAGVDQGLDVEQGQLVETKHGWLLWEVIAAAELTWRR